MAHFTAFQTRYHEHIEANPQLSPDAKRIGYALTCYTGPGTLARCNYKDLTAATGIRFHAAQAAIQELRQAGFTRPRQTPDSLRTGWPLTLPR